MHPKQHHDTDSERLEFGGLVDNILLAPVPGSR